MTLDEFAAEVCERLRADMNSIRNPDGDLHPALFHYFEGESIRRMKIPKGWFSSGSSKDALAKGIEAVHRMTRPDFFAFECTTWFVEIVAPEGTDPRTLDRRAAMGGLMPSEHPDRKETVTVISFSPDETRYHECSITRDGRNPPVFGEWELRPFDHLEGAMFEPLQRSMRR